MIINFQKPKKIAPKNTRNGKLLSNEEKEAIIAAALQTDEGRMALARSMVEPIRRNLDYVAIGRKMLQVDEIPQGYHTFSSYTSNNIKTMDNGNVTVSISGQGPDSTYTTNTGNHFAMVCDVKNGTPVINKWDYSI